MDSNSRALLFSAKRIAINAVNDTDIDYPGAFYNNKLIPEVKIVYGNKYGYTTNNTVYSKTNIVHEDFVTYGHKDGDVVNDITLIELAEPLPFGRYVQTVCLPSKKTVVSREAQVFASGFGSWNDRAVPLDYKREAGLILRETVFPLIPKELCSDRLVKVKPSFSGNVPDTQLCTGSFGHGTAEGDSGGPVVMRTKKGVWYQVGITSWGFNEVENIHKQDDSPGVYTNVHEYCDWIEEKTRGEAKCRDAKLVDATS